MYFSIKQIDEFILRMENHGKTVYILDAMSPMFTIPLNRYNKDYDMFNLGNFGSKGTNGIIEDIEKRQDVLFLILQEEKNWQHPIEITEYVQENAELIGDINLFDIYEK